MSQNLFKSPTRVSFSFRWTTMGCSWASQVDEIAKLALLTAEPVQPPPDGIHAPEVGYAFATGESIAVGQAVLEQPPHHRTVEAGKAVLIDRTSSGSDKNEFIFSLLWNSDSCGLVGSIPTEAKLVSSLSCVMTWIKFFCAYIRNVLVLRSCE